MTQVYALLASLALGLLLAGVVALAEYAKHRHRAAHRRRRGPRHLLTRRTTVAARLLAIPHYRRPRPHLAPTSTDRHVGRASVDETPPLLTAGAPR